MYKTASTNNILPVLYTISEIDNMKHNLNNRHGLVLRKMCIILLYYQLVKQILYKDLNMCTVCGV
ncbi:hypothetical protein V1478_012204 [Vespula squamosa]|uniref:Uncharacterized protein n=1 Tax=Vespula squamosa TaxID=30214 RepID=A0ABD2ACJ5_VESSQ